jgi:hypothetical protein
MNERIKRTDELITQLEDRGRALAKLKKPTALDTLRLYGVRCDLAHRRRDRAQLRLEQLGAEVEEAKRQLVDARATGKGERQALQALERAEQDLHDRDSELAPLVHVEQLKRATAAWQEFRDSHRKELVAELEARGDTVLKQVVEARSLMAAAAEGWQQLDRDAYDVIRQGYVVGSRGSGDLPPFPGFDGQLLPAIPRELQVVQGDPTIRVAKTEEDGAKIVGLRRELNPRGEAA